MYCTLIEKNGAGGNAVYFFERLWARDDGTFKGLLFQMVRDLSQCSSILTL
jgi:hypothetical protein